MNEQEKEDALDILTSNGYEPSIVKSDKLKVVVRYEEDDEDDENEVEAIVDLLTSEGFDPIVTSFDK